MNNPRYEPLFSGSLPDVEAICYLLEEQGVQYKTVEIVSKILSENDTPVEFGQEIIQIQKI